MGNPRTKSGPVRRLRFVLLFIFFSIQTKWEPVLVPCYVMGGLLGPCQKRSWAFGWADELQVEVAALFFCIKKRSEARRGPKSDIGRTATSRRPQPHDLGVTPRLVINTRPSAKELCCSQPPWWIDPQHEEGESPSPVLVKMSLFCRVNASAFDRRTLVRGRRFPIRPPSVVLFFHFLERPQKSSSSA